MARSEAVLLGALLAAVMTAAACGDGVSPRIESLAFDGQAPDSELVLLFSARLLDPDGDLGDGFLETFINGRPSGLGRLELRAIYLFNEVPLDAEEAVVDLSLELSLPNGAPDPGTQFDLGMRAVDAAEHTSETRTVRLQIDPR